MSKHRVGGLEGHLRDLWIGLLQIVGGLVLVALLLGVAVGKWLL